MLAIALLQRLAIALLQRLAIALPQRLAIAFLGITTSSSRLWRGRTTWVYYCSQPSPPNANDEVAIPQEGTSPCSKRTRGHNPSTTALATPGIPDSLSAVKPGTYSSLSEGFRGGGR